MFSKLLVLFLAISCNNANLKLASAPIAVSTIPSAPYVIAVSTAKTNGNYTTGEIIDISIGFSESINVLGTPSLALNSGGNANYQSGSGTSTLNFRYTVASGNASTDLDYTSTSALSLSGGSLKNNSLTNADLTLPSPGMANSISDDKAIIISGLPAALVVVSGPTTVNKGSCSNAIVIERQDSLGSPSIPASTTTITTAGRGAGNFYSTSNCTGAAANSPVILSGSSRITTYFKDTTAETLTLNFSSGALSTDNQNILVTAGFLAKTSVTPASASEHLKLADLDKDGNLDIVAVQSSTNNIGIHWGIGNGTFNATRLDISVQSNPRGVNFGDLDNDGDLDLVVHNWGSQSYSVILNTGARTFAAAAHTAAGGMVLEVTLADLNRDGKLDLVSTSFNTNLLMIRMGTGSGTFGASTTYGACGSPLYSVTYDFDRDGDLDIVVSCLWNTSISYFANNGSGAFAAKVDYTTGSNPGFMDIADFDEDGFMDLIVSNEVSGTASIFIGNGNGTFDPKSDLTVGNFPLTIKTRDINLDGHMDFVVVARNDSQIRVYYGRGNNTFESSQNYSIGGNANGLDIGDINKDGVLDLISQSQTDVTLDIFLGSNMDRTGDLSAESSFNTISNPQDLITGDFNFDSHLDIAVVSSSAGASLLRIHLGVGDATFGAGTDYSLGVSSSSNLNLMRLAMADFNRDGKLDLASTFKDTNQMSVVFGSVTGSFAGATTYATGNSPRGIACSDIDLDGDSDIVVTNFTDNTISVFLNNGSGVFAGKVDYATFTAPISVQLADMNRDGKNDVVVGTDSNRISILSGVGNGTFLSSSNYNSSGNILDIDIADFDRDGDLDLLASHGATNIVSLYLGNGTGAIGVGTDFVTPGMALNTVLNDLTLDGHIDLVCSASATASKIQTLNNNGSLVFSAQSTQSVSSDPVSGISGDFNEDGILDFAYTLWSSSVISIFQGLP